MRPKYVVLPIFFILAGVLAACNSDSGPVGPGPGSQLRYLSANVCSGCHIDMGKEWERTRHASALPDLLAGGHVQDYCIVCHVTGLDGDPANSGYDDPDPVVQERFGGVQCEACHGAGSEHVATFEPLKSNVSGDLCGSCHAGAHHPTYDEWKTSAHADALNERDRSSHFSTECLRCHSADYIFASSVPDTATPADFKYSITCVVCHDPHSKDNDFQLRSDVVTLCGECHNTEDAVPGEGVHHPNADMYRGSGGYEYPGKTYSNSAHTYLGEACVACHMWTSPFDATGNGENAISGHTFKPVIQACRECHADATSFDIFGAQTHVQSLLDALKTELDAATDNDKLTVNYERAKFNYDFVSADGSLGIHNFDYAVSLLEDSIAGFEPGS